MPKEGKYYITEKGEDLRLKLNEEDGEISADIYKAGYGSSDARPLVEAREDLRVRFYLLDDARLGFNWPDELMTPEIKVIVEQFERAGYLEFVPYNRELD